MPEPALRLSRAAAVMTIAIGIAVLGGWAFDISALKTGLPGLNTTQPWSAVLLVMTGLATFALASSAPLARYLALALASLTLLVAAEALAGAILPLDMPIERWLFADAIQREQAGSRPVPGQLPDTAAIIYVFIALALFLSRSRTHVSQTAFITVATMGLLIAVSVTVGFLFDVHSLRSSPLYGELSLPRALGQTIVIFGVLCLRPDLGWVRLLAENTPAAREMRSLAVGAIALPLALASILQIGLRAGLYDAEMRTALLVLGSIIVVFVALLMTAARLRRIDAERQRSYETQQRVEAELRIALAAAKMVVLHYDLPKQTIRRLAAGDSNIRLTEVHSYDEHLRLVHPDDRPTVAAYLQQQLSARERDYQLQYRLGARSQVKWVLEKGEIRYEDDVPTEISSVMLDVTQAVRAHEALLESEERFRRVAESMPQIVYVCDAAGEVEYVNQRWVEYTGSTLATRARIAELMPAEDLATLDHAWQRALATGEGFTTELRVKGVDGAHRWFLMRVEPVQHSDGRIVRWCGTSTDIDAQKRAHEELRLVTDHADILLAHCDAQARYVFVNKTYSRRFGVLPEEVRGKTIREVVGPSAYERIEPYVQRALAGETVTFEVEVPYQKLGSKYMSCRYVPDIDRTTGEVRGFVAAIDDITERRQLEEQLREADRRKDEFIALLAHELRNPLAPIRYAAGLLRPGVPQEISAAAQDVIERQVGHMARLLDDLLDVSRITRNSLELRLELVDLREIVSSAVDTVRPLFEAVNHQLTMSLPPEPAIVSGDSARLLQIVGNLLNNAAKYTEPGGRIQVEVTEHEGSFVLRVRDTGIGIAPDLLPKLFDLFVQGDRTQTRASSGLGVGLSLAKRLVEMHSGTIEARSEGINRGSEFTVRLPAALEERASEPKAVNENVLPIFHRKHQLMIVDDNLDAANSLAILAQMSGYVTHIANDGLAAIEMAELVRPEAIIMDLGMPKMTGFEAARWVRQQPWGSDTVLIAVTGWGGEEDRRRSREAGFDVHLTKPVDSTELLNQLQRRTQMLSGESNEMQQ